MFKTLKYELTEIRHQTQYLCSTWLLQLIKGSDATWTELPGGEKPSRIRIIWAIAKGCSVFSEKVAEGRPYIYRYHTMPCVPNFTAFPCQLQKGEKNPPSFINCQGSCLRQLEKESEQLHLLIPSVRSRIWNIQLPRNHQQNTNFFNSIQY